MPRLCVIALHLPLLVFLFRLLLYKRNHTISIPSSSVAPEPSLKTDSNTEIDYHTHPNIPTWILDIHKRLDAAETCFSTILQLEQKNKELTDLLSTAQSQIADLESKLSNVKYSALQKVPAPIAVL